MVLFYLSVQLSLIVLTAASGANDNTQQKKSFLWGAATASYQIEGGYDEGGRGMSVWDEFSHTPGKTANGDTGDIADDSYHKWQTDIELLQELGVNAYRFSLSWSRILPNGTGTVNMEGLEYYSRIINALLDAKIEPLVTLFHWDTPLALEESIGGWLSSDMETYFAEYAKVCFEIFGDRVKYWLTINEPMTVALNGYLSGEHAPGRCSNRSICTEGNSSSEPYIVAHNLLNAHAAAVELFRSDFQPIYGGEISIVINSDFAYPFDAHSSADEAAAQRDLEFQAGWFADPVYFGRYPPSMRALVGDRLPQFSPEQSSRIKGSTDFYGFNHYSSRYYASVPPDPNAAGGWFDDQLADVSNINSEGHVIGPVAESSWLNVVPRGIEDMLLWLAARYNNPKILITENGVDAPGESTLPLDEALNDTFRVGYFKGYLEHVMRAKEEGGVNVQGYFAWSLLDNFEWSDGYNCRFGLHYVDYSDNRKRYTKNSAKWYKHFISTH